MAERPASVTVAGRALHEPWNEGTRVIARNLGLASAGRGHDVRLVSLTDLGYGVGPDVSGLATYHVRTPATSPLVADYRNVRPLAGAIRHAAGAAGTHLHLIGAPLALAPLVRGVARTTVVHVVLNARDTGLSTVDRVRAALGWRLFDRWVDAYACTSEAVREALERDGWNAGKLLTLEPPVDTGVFHRAAARRPAADSALRVVYVGNIAAERFPARAIVEALGAVARQTGLRIALDVHAPVAFRPDNAEWAAAVPDSGDVQLNVGLEDLTEERKVAVYSGADVMLYPYLRPVAVEPPLTLLEAMACEAVPVAAPPANRSGVVADGRNGLTFEGPEELAAALVRFASLGDGERAALGRAARQTIEARFGFAATAGRLEELRARLERSR
jgi:glycosyltransferase involved in cell wall biosynthesis